MVAPIRVNSVTFNGGSVVNTEAADIVVLVGPNNTGKSRSLQEMQIRLGMHAGQPLPPNVSFVVSAVDASKSMNAEEITDWFRNHRYRWTDPNDTLERARTVNAGEVLIRDIPAHWHQSPNSLGPLAGHLVRGLFCGERLTYLGSPTRQELGAHPEHPIHWLVHDETLLSAFREAFRAAFGMHVILDAWGANVRLRLSATETQADFIVNSDTGLPSREISERLAALPLIEEQSDGVRSFAGILLTLLTAHYPLILLDEPEAFLHPPQARLLGRSLAELQRDGQLFVATHSLDVLLGLIEARPERVQIVRLTRDSGRTFADVLAPEQLADLWRDPLLRFSRALDGLFHDGVVVGEGDTDSQFYSGVSALRDEDGVDLARGRHVMYTYAGSKARIPLINKALRALGVPVRCIVDFDALNDRGVLSALVMGQGVDYDASFESDRALVDAHLRGSEPKVKAGPLVESIRAIVGDDPDHEVDRSAIRDIRKALEPETGWRAAKRAGKAAVPPGEATVAVDRLLEALATVGVFVVPSGEVESFVRAVGGKGPGWAVEVAEGNYLDSAHQARAFVSAVLTSLPGARL